MLPKDPVILLSFINTKLRDFYSSLNALCDDLEIDKNDLIFQLESIGYKYCDEQNQFIWQKASPKACLLKLFHKEKY